MRHRRNRGFALAITILSMGFIALTLGALAGQLRSDSRRTRATEADAQLRLLLLAGQAFAHDLVLEPTPEPRTITAPPVNNLPPTHIELTPTPADATTTGTWHILVRAEMAGFHLTQRLTYHRDGTTAHLLAAEILP